MNKIYCPACSNFIPIKKDIRNNCCPLCEKSQIIDSKPLVNVICETEIIAKEIYTALQDTNFFSLFSTEGRDIFRNFPDILPDLFIIDVGISDVVFFQLIEEIKQKFQNRQLKVILIASIFNKTAYKRSPVSLYGADDYLEQHHIPDQLPQKICQLFGMNVVNKPDNFSMEVQERIRKGASREDLIGEDRLHKLAHSIIADIALYNEEDIRAAMSGNISNKLTVALAEGLRLLEQEKGHNPEQVKNEIHNNFIKLIQSLDKNENGK